MNSSTNAHAKTVRKVSNNKVKLEISSCPGVKKGSSEACSNIQGNKKSTAVKAIKKVQENKKSTKANAIKEESRPGTFLSTNLPTKKEESKLKKKEYIPEKISSSETVFPKKEPKPYWIGIKDFDSIPPSLLKTKPILIIATSIFMALKELIVDSQSITT